MAALGSRGRLNFFWELTAAGKGGAENMAATTLMRVIQDCICSRLLGRKPRPWDRGSGGACPEQEEQDGGRKQGIGRWEQGWAGGGHARGLEEEDSPVCCA